MYTLYGEGAQISAVDTRGKCSSPLSSSFAAREAAPVSSGYLTKPISKQATVSMPPFSSPPVSSQQDRPSSVSTVMLSRFLVRGNSEASFPAQEKSEAVALLLDRHTVFEKSFLQPVTAAEENHVDLHVADFTPAVTPPMIPKVQSRRLINIGWSSIKERMVRIEQSRHQSVHVNASNRVQDAIFAGGSEELGTDAAVSDNRLNDPKLERTFLHALYLIH